MMRTVSTVLASRVKVMGPRRDEGSELNRNSKPIATSI